jgi:superfamily II DNA helicase RecQ
MTLADYRHFILAIEKKIIRPKATLPVGGMGGEDEDEDGALDSAWDQVAGHGSTTALAAYAREIGFAKKLTPEAVDLFHMFAKEYHRFYGVLSGDVKPTRVVAGLQGLMTGQEKQEEVNRVMTLWYGAGYSWRSTQQKLATEAIIAGTSPLFVVLPTSAGKTTTYLLPAKMKGSRTTVVITPLIALGKQLQDTCEEFGLDVVTFTKDRTRRANVVIVVTETAGTDEFREFIMELQLNKHLDRVIWDEAHMLVMDQNYRRNITDSRSLHLSCQLVFVTATCPKTYVDEICEIMILSQPQIIRQDFWKPAFKYSVMICAEVNRTAKDVIKRMREEVGEHSKILVFCKTGKEATQWAREYRGARKYYSALRNKEQEWDSWMGGIMFATTAVGAGMHKDGVERVLHIGDPYSLVGYIQEAGRAGRGGDYVEAVILMDQEIYVNFMSTVRESLTEDEAALQSFLRGDVCRNEILTGFLNGTGRTCMDLDTPLCDVCHSHQTGDFSSRKRRTEDLIQELRNQVKRQRTFDSQARMKEQEVAFRIEMWDRIEIVKKEIGSGCPVCWFLTEEDYNLHSLGGCRVWQSCFGGLTMGGIRRKFVDYNGLKVVCWTCGLPGDRCPEYANAIQRCSGQDIVLPVVLYFWQQGDSAYHGLVGRALGRSFKDLESLGLELVRRARVLEENGSVAFKIWLEIFKQRVMN